MELVGKIPLGRKCKPRFRPRPSSTDDFLRLDVLSCKGRQQKFEPAACEFIIVTGRKVAQRI